MKVLVFGLGLQGKAAIHDLEQSDAVSEIVAADAAVEQARAYVDRKAYRKVRVVHVNASEPALMEQLVRESRPQVVVCMLPADFQPRLARAALDAGVSYVSSSYTGELVELDRLAKERGVTILPEMGMDPGIDLMLGRLAVDELDVVHGMRSYGAGLPEPACAADNPIRYKITWTFEGVLKAYMRPARFLRDGKEAAIPAGQIFRPENGHPLEVPGVGTHGRLLQRGRHPLHRHLRAGAGAQGDGPLRHALARPQPVLERDGGAGLPGRGRGPGSAGPRYRPAGSLSSISLPACSSATPSATWSSFAWRPGG